MRIMSFKVVAGGEDMLNKSKGNMYDWCDFTWNVIKGECPHQCSYCYCKKWGKQSPLHFDEKELKTDLGNGNFIFVGSSCDMWADDIPVEWIELVLEHCRLHPHNTYLFQSKNPQRIIDWTCDFPPKTLIGTTIETNRTYSDEVYKAPYRRDRYIAMTKYDSYKMVSIEPIMDFDLDVIVEWMREIKPQFVSIGANTNYKVQLPEPPSEKVKILIEALQQFTEVKLKSNLRHLLGIRYWGSL